MSVITPQKNAVNHSEPSLGEKKKRKNTNPTTKLFVEIYPVFSFKVRTKKL